MITDFCPTEGDGLVIENSFISRYITQQVPPDNCSIGTDPVSETIYLVYKVQKPSNTDNNIHHRRNHCQLTTVSGCREGAKSSCYNVCEISHEIQHNSIIFFVTPRAIHKHVWNNSVT
jgi:hypothetical protein